MNLTKQVQGILLSQLLSTVFATPLLIKALQPTATEQSTVPSPTIIYKNKRYRFRFVLPASWKGFSVLAQQWSGSVMNDEWQMVREEKGPLIVIRHPLWTEEKERQGIPIMIFNLDQWKLVDEGKIILSAAPVGPSEIGRNKKYVFALPARYNYALPEGWEEVEKIVSENALQPY